MRSLLLLLVLAVPVGAEAQLVPGRHSLIPAVGVALATSDLLETTTPIAFGVQPLPPEENEQANPVTTTIGLDPGVVFGLRYTYDLTRRLAVEVDGSFGISVFVIEMLEHLPEATGEPQFETTTMDARMWRYGLNLAYHVGNWRTFHPFVLGGIGGQVMDLRQKGSLKTDPIRDATFVVGAGGYFRVSDALGIRAELRDTIYNFQFDNQFAGPESWQIVAYRDVGRAVAVSQPQRQHDLTVTLGFQIRVH